MGQSQSKSFVLSKFYEFVYLYNCEKFDEAKNIFNTYLKNNKKIIFEEKNTIDAFYRSLRAISIKKNANINFAKWLLENFTSESNETIHGDIFENSIIKGNMDFAMWILENYNIEPQTKKNAFCSLLGYGNCYTNYSEKKNAFIIAKWMYHDLEISKSLSDIECQDIFDRFCEIGDVEFIEWILTFEQKITINAKHICFILERGNYSFAKKLAEIGKITISDIICEKLNEIGLQNYFEDIIKSKMNSAEFVDPFDYLIASNIKDEEQKAQN